eukprot:7962929-Alexandrium_andersonii.AAC.1
MSAVDQRKQLFTCRTLAWPPCNSKAGTTTCVREHTMGPPSSGPSTVASIAMQGTSPSRETKNG